MKKALFNGCSRSQISVLPKNWKTQRASTKKPWTAYYRFYDPAFRDDPKLWGKLFPIKGMNEFKDLADRQKITQDLIDEEMEQLDVKGYNPITEQFMILTTDTQVYEISPDALFIEALRAGHKKLDVVPDVFNYIGNILNAVEKAAGQLFDNRLQKQYSDLCISQVSTRHIKHILELCSTTNSRWSNRLHNTYKTYLSMIFKELLQAEAVEFNPTRDILTKKKVKKIRPVITIEELSIIDQHLYKKSYNFWRYMRIFFRSGSRTTELLSLKKDEKISLETREFILTVKKGKEYREDVRPITKDVLHLWQEVWDQAKPGQHLFSWLLQPGDKKIRKDQICRRWNKYVKAPIDKGGLGIGKDFYTLKHRNLDEIDKMLGLNYAKDAAGHTNGNTTGIYTVGAKQRRIDTLKEVEIKIA